jgi:para-nitrobenzyl esterase
MKKQLFLILCASLLAVPGYAEPIKVTSKAGALVGESNGKINSFKGIPFAQAPVGELRWQPPQPFSWEGEKQATEFSLPCLQNTYPDRPNGGGVSGDSSEDCLTLNIWAPANAVNAPIMVWIFGGGGVVGAGSVQTYDGSNFARDGIILVTINYRLGALAGFAHPKLTQAAKATEGAGEQGFGNYHLLDAMAALRWMKNNAAVFGGDPNNVTVFGESAGATITANLLTSPMTQGLFDKAIIESTGSLPTPATSLEQAEELGVKAMAALGLSEKATVEEMRKLPALDLISHREAGRGVRTILDGYVKAQSILDSFATGTAIDVPTIIGTNSDEGRLRGTQLVATHAQSGAPVFQYFFDYVPDWRRDEQPNGAPHAAEIPYVFDNVTLDRRVGDRSTKIDQAVAARIHSCWVAFAKMSVSFLNSSRTISCADGFEWPARTDENNKTVAIFQEKPSLGRADDLRSPPNGAEPGPTSRP